MKRIFCEIHVLKSFDQLKGEMNLYEDATRQQITIGGIPHDAILLKLDVDVNVYKKRSAYFRTGLEFIHKGCDFCLILPTTNQALLFELKSKHPKGYADQFVASELFIDYCNKVWNRFNCNNHQLNYVRVLLSDKYNSIRTDRKKLQKLVKPDRCKNDVEIITPGFPRRIRLEKFLMPNLE